MLDLLWRVFWCIDFELFEHIMVSFSKAKSIILGAKMGDGGIKGYVHYICYLVFLSHFIDILHGSSDHDYG